MGTVSPTESATQRQSPIRATNVVLVHGAYADGSCWSDVIARLQLAGLNVMAVQTREPVDHPCVGTNHGAAQ